jgi:hypothetical protein
VVDFLDLVVVSDNWLGMYAFLELDQTITIEAEHYALNSPGKSCSWFHRANIDAAGHGYMQALPHVLWEKLPLSNLNKLYNFMGILPVLIIQPPCL